MGVMEMRSAGMSAASIPQVVQEILQMYNACDIEKKQHRCDLCDRSHTKSLDIKLVTLLYDWEFSDDG